MPLEPSAVEVAKPSAAEHDCLQSFIRLLGGRNATLVATLVVRDLAHMDVDEDLRQVVEKVFGHDSPINTMCTRTSLAQALDKPRRTASRLLHCLAAIVYGGSCSLAASAFARHCLQMAAGKWRAVSVMTLGACDETPLPLRVGDAEEAEDYLAPTYSGPSRVHEKDEPGTSNILQMEYEVVIVSQDVASKEYHCVSISMPQPLAVLERGTADCVRAALTQAHQELRG